MAEEAVKEVIFGGLCGLAAGYEKIENTVIPRKISIEYKFATFVLGILPRNCLCQLLGLLQLYHFSGSGLQYLMEEFWLHGVR